MAVLFAAPRSESPACQIAFDRQSFRTVLLSQCLLRMCSNFCAIIYTVFLYRRLRWCVAPCRASQANSFYPQCSYHSRISQPTHCQQNRYLLAMTSVPIPGNVVTHQPGLMNVTSQFIGGSPARLDRATCAKERSSSGRSVSNLCFFWQDRKQRKKKDDMQD